MSSLYLPKENALFIHIPKTGGTSIGEILTEHGAMKTKFRLEGSPNHSSIFDVKKEFPDAFRFAIVRNPWDRMWSLYKHLLYSLGHYLSFDEFLDCRIETLNESQRRKFIQIRGISEVDDFTRGNSKYTQWKLNQTDYIYNEEDRLCVDKVLRYEDFDQAIWWIGKKFQIDMSGIRHTKDSVRRLDGRFPLLYFNYYTEGQIEKVAEICHRDIKTLRYSFLT